MRLKQIKLAGFKSFVDPTTVNLPGSLSAVVGPNGCGKSNIIDAVRWVMGESSAKQLRGENITDVIFNGSSARRPTAAASIELLFDNSDGRVGGQYAAYAELAIRREVNREAQSTYYLNGSKCRRRDIQDVFLGTGFGPRSYSIIEQGMINQLVEAKPDDLRSYLEEAAGISKYKERRRETENRIRHTTENLSRLNDIREELGKQLDRLQRQAKAAERYRELKEEERQVTAQFYTLRYNALAERLRVLDEQIRERTVALEQANAEHRRIETEIESLRAGHSDQTGAFNRVQAKFYQLGADIARIEESIEYSTRRVQQLELDLEGVTERSSETERQLQMDEADIARVNGEIARVSPAVEEARAADDDATSRLQAAEQAQKEWQSAWDDFSSRLSRTVRDAEVQASRIEHLEQLLQRLRRRSEELAAASQEAPQFSSEHVDSLAEEIDALDHTKSAAEADIDRVLRDLHAAREDLSMREQVVEQARGDVQALRHDLASLEAVQAAALGRDDGSLETWLEAQGLSGAGKVGETLAVVGGWEQAVETVLGAFLHGVRVNSLDAYAAALNDTQAGNLALLEKASQPAPEGALSSDLPSLATLVRGDVAELGSLLAGVYAAESVAVAMDKRQQLAAHESIITRGGVWVGPDWLSVAPEATAESGIIQRGQEIETLNLRVEEAESTLADLLGQVRTGRDHIQQLERDREQLQERVNQLNSSLAERRTDHGVRRVQLQEAVSRRERLHKELEDLARQIAEESERLADARQHLAVAETTREELEGEREGLLGRREGSEQQLEEARGAARACRDRFHAVSSELAALNSRRSAGETARERLVKQLDDLRAQQNSLRSGIEQSNTPLPELKQKLEQQLEERKGVETQLAEVRTRLEEIDTTVRAQENARHAAEEKVAEVRNLLEDGRVKRQGMSVEESNLLERITATGLSLEDAAAGLPEDATESVWQESLERIERRIQRLGAINLAAIDEFKTESERKTYLDAQNEDLVEALNTLREAIRKIDRETRTRFKETFETVNKRLGELFPKVFGGGHAHLELTGEDLLDTGVALMARPPGKRNTSVHLLSGGEKAMTAIALIFAIFHLNPSPVCLLDEVDAPLDDANVTRYAELIKEMSADVQFVVITHNKLTMEIADHLMGVTMNEPGVSRLVSVDVGEAVALAAV